MDACVGGTDPSEAVNSMSAPTRAEADIYLHKAQPVK